ncbi:DUF6705 family protein [Chryseobacterium sp. 2TAF14]|uniref:DUF6705 family protein n=1 Tax=Chryseobacterium sp. 2TAF14 TaxID=3233007 RepID=UPI003F935064
MKNIIIKTILIASILMGINMMKSQNIIALGGNNGTLPKDFQNTGQYYYKDVYNYLDGFLGTWEYVNGSEKFQVILTKITKYHEVSSSSPYMNFNYYTDGIALRYKKFVNGNLIFESPLKNIPTLESRNGLELEGSITDYGRVTASVPKPQIMGNGNLIQGGEYFTVPCSIEKMPVNLSTNEPLKIKFNLYLRENFGQYNNPIYNGLPTFSIPNDIIMTKVP